MPLSLHQLETKQPLRISEWTTVGFYWNTEVSSFFVLLFRESTACLLLSVWFTLGEASYRIPLSETKLLLGKFQSHDKTFGEMIYSQNNNNKGDVQNHQEKGALFIILKDDWIWTTTTKIYIGKAEAQKQETKIIRQKNPVAENRIKVNNKKLPWWHILGIRSCSKDSVCVCVSYKSYELCVIETSILYIWKLRAWKLSWAIKDLELLRG